ncbi:undecaprenyl-phosphate glucose phosphotransferase [Vibrio viridaestus]|uniref:Undecaprenyl-phosphate glucose phosphotransferase n=1 Tax=Vibrio viridaestus TaxID=2487322 RepID=A0A3N9TI38_9VIBR|nr:undecaprenyl-phosphate glucose phosphotransferase [Vibrio viridaestus]RQW63881.1 undecaprenyl-phosphate glucose phosphotransferase [Vibrio viridaestus]
MGSNKRIKYYGEESSVPSKLFDLFWVALILNLLAQFYTQTFSVLYQLAMFFVLFVYYVVAEVAGVYKPNRYTSFTQTSIGILTTWSVCVATSLAIAFFVKVSEEYSRVVLGGWFVVTPVVLIAWRLVCRKLYRFLRSTRSKREKSIIIGATSSGLQLATELKDKYSETEMLIGIYDDRGLDRIGKILPSTLRGRISDALLLAKHHSVDNVYIALPMEAAKRIKDILNAFSDTNAKVHIVPDFFIFDLMQSRVRSVGNMVTVSIFDTPFYGFTTVVKRLEDIFIGSIILALISPILVIIAIGVKLSSPGPIIFKQERYGLDGRLIKVWKFRSMKSMDNGSVVKQATKNDPRVTPFGAFIRRTSLDELPQFINVITGQMSIVGPRPHAVAHNEEYRGLINKYMLRHHVKPGITGWAQVNGFRGETDTLDKMEKRIEYDLLYIQSWSLWLDMKIIFLTIFKGFIGKTAY